MPSLPWYQSQSITVNTSFTPHVIQLNSTQALLAYIKQSQYKQQQQQKTKVIGHKVSKIFQQQLLNRPNRPTCLSAHTNTYSKVTLMVTHRCTSYKAQLHTLQTITYLKILIISLILIIVLINNEIRNISTHFKFPSDSIGISFVDNFILSHFLLQLFLGDSLL